LRLDKTFTLTIPSDIVHKLSCLPKASPCLTLAPLSQSKMAW
jgi:hypothetical protein